MAKVLLTEDEWRAVKLLLNYSFHALDGRYENLPSRAWNEEPVRY